MKGGGHFGLGMLAFITSVTALHGTFNVPLIMMAGIMGLLPDVDVALNVEHRKYTHTIVGGTLMVAAVVLVFGYWSLPIGVAMGTAVLSHYAADFAYCRLLKRILRNPSKNPVDFAEFISTGVLSSSAISVLLVYLFPALWIVMALVLLAGLAGVLV